jgi:hypothetical protein
MKMVVMKLGNTPRPAAWSPPLAFFPPPVLILATSSPNFFLKTCIAHFSLRREKFGQDTTKESQPKAEGNEKQQIKHI